MSEIALECDAVTKSFGGFRAVHDVSAPFEIGKITALIGPNGAGKTTLFHLISGALKPDSGSILYRGRSINGLAPWEVARLGVGRLFQDVRVFERLSAVENVLVACRNQVGEHPLATFLDRRRMWREEAKHEAEALRWLELVSLAGYRTTRAESLSYGQQKLLALARLLAAGADVLLLDEPTAGVHPSLVDRLLGVIRSLAAEGRTVVVIEHDMNVVLKVSDWVYFMDHGQLVAFGSPEEVLADPEVRTAYLGLPGAGEVAPSTLPEIKPLG